MDNLYIHTEDVHNLKAPTEIVPIILSLLAPKTLLDVGCGIGTWLKVFERHGVKDFLGVDGEYVDKRLMMIPEEKFLALDLRKEFSLNRKFDLVVSLEVAEHLPEESANGFVKSLTEHGDVILFSAAIPGQGGQNHLNEQWPSYWQEKFKRHNFYFHDIIRPLIWDNKLIDSWYRQNIFIVSRQYADQKILSVVHPDLLNEHLIIINNMKRRTYGVRHHFNKIVEILYKRFF
jgi:SAM-dependent methyltransferase